MLRGLTILLFFGAVGFISMPFVMASRALDERGIEIPGRIYHKDEYIRVRSSDWERSRDVTIEYTIPETGGVSYFDVHPDEPQFDMLRTGQPVRVKYLRRRDVPAVPMADFLWQMHALPMVRFMNLRKTAIDPGIIRAVEALGSLAVLFILWRTTRNNLFAWATGLGAAAGLGFLLLQGFPRPTPAPLAEVLRGSGTVKTISRIDKLFAGTRSRGMVADQPVDVVGIEFVPEGRTEVVTAVDLIDRGSVPGLKEKSTVPIRYESRSPRTAWIEGATRGFPRRNLSGIILQIALTLAVLAGLLFATQWIGRAFRRLIARRTS
jgi:hypothetical protein